MELFLNERPQQDNGHLDSLITQSVAEGLAEIILMLKQYCPIEMH